MCGITGIVDLVSERPIEPRVLRAMNDLLRLRGPDGDGFHFEPGVGFGHRRLSIIDLEGGKQPLANEDGSVIVTFNGEIYNFIDLMTELIRRGHTFRTRCDTEVIVHAWEEWGPACLQRFNGMFAFALWDRNNRTLFLARDRLGVKPLYYTWLADGRVAFASELKSLLVLPEVPRELDPLAIEDYMTFGYVPDPRSIYSGVRKLEPGSYLRVERGVRGALPVRYWDVPLEGETVPQPDERALCEDLHQQLKSAVKRRLVADVPLGSFLSGGIDSSAVVAMMRELGGPRQRILTCSIGFREPQYDESGYARMVADRLATDHRTETVEASDFSLLDKLVDIYDEPFADSSAIPTYRVCQLARRHVTVALSGDAGDENFIGYRRYRLFAAEERLRNLFPANFRRTVFGLLGRAYPKLDWAPRVFRGKSTFQGLARDSIDAYLHAVSMISADTRRDLLTREFRATLHGYTARDWFRKLVEGKRFPDSLAMVQYLDFRSYLPGDILTKVDRASMANSLEVRAPFLDYQLVEWAAGLPSSVKLRGGEGKYILKQALQPMLPKEVLFRSKMGFAVPIDIWFRGSLRERILDALTGTQLRNCGIFQPAELERLASEHQSGRRNHSAVLWALLMFDGFLRRRNGKASAADPLPAAVA